METLADYYKEDASYYAAVSKDINQNAAELRTSIENINTILDTIDLSQKELNQAVQSVNKNLQQLTGTSDTVSRETQDVADSVTILQQRFGSFRCKWDSKYPKRAA